MFKSFFTITFRSLFRQGVFSVINIIGLSIGLALVLLFSLYNFKEQSFDRSFKESKNIYRINALTKEDKTYFTTASALSSTLKAEIPEVITTVRTICRWYDMLHNENSIGIHMVWADEDFFRLFDTPFILGSSDDVMSRPNAIAISESEAKRLFGNDDPIGQMLAHAIYVNLPPLEVVAVFKDYPQNSSLREHKIIAPFISFPEAPLYRIMTWTMSEFETFCLLVANANAESVNEKIRKTVSDATADQQTTFTPELQRLTDIHLNSKKYLTLSTHSIHDRHIGDIEKVNLLSLLSVIILLIACINYMNICTARAQKRSREIGISKTVGATRIGLIVRLTLETAILTFISFILAWILAWVMLPVFNNLMGEQLNFGLAFQPVFLCIALLIWIVTSLLAASYPAMYMSGFQPLTAIRSQSVPGSSHATIRKALTVGQFVIAIVLISWVLIIRAQIEFVNNKDLGYNPRNLIGFWINDSNPTVLLDEFRSQSSVEMVSRENRLGNIIGVSENILYRDQDDKTGFPLKPNATEPDYFDLMQMKMIAGGTFSEPVLRDTIISTPTGDRRVLMPPASMQIVLNRAAVDYLGMTPEEAIGQRVMARVNGLYGIPVICGVIENYHYESLHRPVGGVCMHYGIQEHKRFLLLRVTEGDLSEQLKTYEAIFKKYFPNNRFTPVFIDTEVAKLYDGERRTSRIAVVFSILAIFISCMGVFGLTAFMAEQRTKEIGIRKVMGASVWNIVSLFTVDYLKLLGISLAIAIPAAWWVGERYLQNFAYHISLSWWIFAVAALITVALTLLTVGILAIKAAMKNPVEVVKMES